jgi:hypothetical protein
MKKVFLSTLLIALLAVVQSCIYINSDEGIAPRGESTRTFDLRNFDELEMGDAFYVNVTWGSSFSVAATGERNDLDDLEMFVQDGTLVARYRSWRNSRRKMTIDVTMPDLESVDFSGAVNASIIRFENLPSVEIDLSGASRCDFNGTSREVKFDLSGASRLNLSGNSKFFDGELGGASQLNARDFQAEESNLRLSGASVGRVWVTKLLEVDASGASTLGYRGNPALKQKVSGGSVVRPE